MTDLGNMKEDVNTLTRQMQSILKNQSRIIESNERSDDGILQIQRMMGALIVLVIIGLFMM